MPVPRRVRHVAAALAMLGLVLTGVGLPSTAEAAPADPVLGPAEVRAGAAKKVAASRPPQRRSLPNRYIVTLAEGVAVPDVVRAHKGHVRAGRRFKSALPGFAARMGPAAAARLLADERVVSVEQDELLELSRTQHPATWGLDRIDQRARPRDRTYTYTSAGRGVAVYVLDTGVFARHREFGRRVKRGFDATGKGSTADCEGHGTHVAATIGGRRFGVAKAVRIIPVRVARCSGYIRKSYLLAGLDFVARHHRAGQPAVANLSLGGPPSRAVDRAVKRVIRDGVTVVVAAGNSAYNACYLSPARVKPVLTVGAVNQYDRAPYWSNYGPCLDMFAPGVRIRSAVPATRTASREYSGTSMAAPHVAGAAARYLSRHRRATPAAVARHLNATALTGIVGDPGQSTTDKMLYLRARVPVKLVPSVSTSSLLRGDKVTARAVLRNRRSGTPMPGKQVVLQTRRIGTNQWKGVAARTTTARGRVALPQWPTIGTEYRFVHRRTPTSTRAISAVRRVAVGTVGVRITAFPSLWSVAAGQPVTLQGAATRDDGAVLNGIVVRVERKTSSGSWALVETRAPDGSGSFAAVTVRPSVTTTYRVRHAGTATTKAAISNLVEIEVLEP